MPIFYKIPATPKIIKPDVITKKGYIKELKEKIITDKTLALVKPLISYENNKHDIKEISTPNNIQSPSNANQTGDKHHLFTIERIENLSNLFVHGKSKFQDEYNYAEKHCHRGVDFVLDHVIDSDGIGEPEEYEEVLEQNYDHKLNFC